VVDTDGLIERWITIPTEWAPGLSAREIDVAHRKCTLGEMVQAMADVYGRYTGGPEW